MMWPGKKIILGCNVRGDGDSPYLTRYTLLRTCLCSVYLHRFHRSDGPDLHDHPWPFASLILWRGYVEVSRSEDLEGPIYYQRRERKWPGMILLRSARHVHRVELVDEKPAVTLVVTGPIVRRWGFWTETGWEHFKSYFQRMGCDA